VLLTQATSTDGSPLAYYTILSSRGRASSIDAASTPRALPNATALLDLSTGLSASPTAMDGGGAVCLLVSDQTGAYASYRFTGAELVLDGYGSLPSASGVSRSVSFGTKVVQGGGVDGGLVGEVMLTSDGELAVSVVRTASSAEPREEAAVVPQLPADAGKVESADLVAVLRSSDEVRIVVAASNGTHLFAGAAQLYLQGDMRVNDELSSVNGTVSMYLVGVGQSPRMVSAGGLVLMVAGGGFCFNSHVHNTQVRHTVHTAHAAHAARGTSLHLHATSHRATLNTVQPLNTVQHLLCSRSLCCAHRLPSQTTTGLRVWVRWTTRSAQ
jgi:hypothetical protein